MPKTLSHPVKITVDGSRLSVPQICRAVSAGERLHFVTPDDLPAKMRLSVNLVEEAVSRNATIYGVTTGFGGMAGVAVDRDESAASQNNLLAFLASGAGEPIDRRHVKTAMLLRANVLSQGCSGVRFEIVDRLLRFLHSDVTPVVRELGSIGASGDLVPLAVIARAITGQARSAKVQIGDRNCDARVALSELGMEPIKLLPKEGLAIVNGTSFSSAIAANSLYESRSLMGLAFATQAMILQALQVQEEPFEEFVQQKKPHLGQKWSAAIMRRLLREGRSYANGKPLHVQDRYSLRCFPQYMGAIVEGLARVQSVIETEMNAVSDNPLIDTERGQFFQSGNFLGQYVALAMDDLRRYIGLMAKHLDVQVAMLVTPEFNGGLPASLLGNEHVAYNMGLKGLQITGNSIMPMLTWYANPTVEHFPTHAEQFNQNINGLSWGSANLAWKSVELFQHYLSTSLIFALQALDLRAKSALGHYDGRGLLGSLLTPLYDATYSAIGCSPGKNQPLVFDDLDQSLEDYLASLHSEISNHGSLVGALDPILESFDDTFC